MKGDLDDCGGSLGSFACLLFHGKKKELKLEGRHEYAHAMKVIFFYIDFKKHIEY
jgi:hypothetical protein